MTIVERNIADLVFAEYNPRKLSADQERALRDSLTRFGFVDPAVINVHPDRQNIVVGGHQRLRVWAALGHTTAPTVAVELDRDRERELNIRLNRNTGEWDWDALSEYFDRDDLADWGFDDEELADLFGDEDGNDDIPADNKDIDEESMKDTKNECPKCGFKW